ncbi:MAG: carbohydrate-binding domain-containing protein [Eubacterium sp.]
MTKRRFFSIILSAIMAFSAVTAFYLVATQSTVVAYAAGISAPSVTASNASYKSIKLTWKKVKGAKKYTVMRSTKKNSGYKAIKTVTKNTYTDTKATCGKTYYYKVIAVNGNTKKTSKAVKIKCTPAKVSGVKGVSSACSNITISFKKVSGANGYDIRYCNTKNGTYKSIAITKSTSYTHSIGVGNTGYYKVRAYRTVNGKKVYGPYSSVVSATALSHSYGSYTVEKSPTCGEEGTKYTVCSICGDKHYEVMPATGEHAYTITTKDATCTEAGEIVKACKYCDKTIITPIEAKGHSYNKITVSPACTDNGYDKYTCNVCNSSYTDNYTNPLGHSFTNYISDNNATCTSDATETATCNRCDVTDTKSITGTKLEHIYEGEIVSNNNGSHKIYCSYGCGNFKEKTCEYSYEAILLPTHNSDGIGKYTCFYCNYSYEVTVPAVECDHVNTTVINKKDATCTENGYTGDIQCNDCGTILLGGTVESAVGHNYVTTPETCTEPSHRDCTVCGAVDPSHTPIPAKGHTVSTNYAVNDIAGETHLYYICPDCSQEIETDTFCLNITGVTADSLSAYAGVAELSASGNKITLTATKYVDKFEISGTANDITISVDAYDDAEVKLCSVTITNETTEYIDDCIRINDKCTEIDSTTGEKVVPTVSISAKDGTVNTLKVTATGGNAIQSETKLEFKGHGTLNMETVSTSVDARAKVYIKNLTMNITSSNRGIDTKIETKDSSGQVIDTEYANISFGANANVTVNSADDGIRCKNMTFEAFEAVDDTDTIVKITSGGDALQLEGGKGLTMNQGQMELKGTKSAVNEKSGLNTYQTYVSSGRITVVS